MNNQRKPTIAARVLPIPGRQLPGEWRAETAHYGGTYDRRNLEELWKQPKWQGASQENITQDARLSAPTWNDLFGSK
jgi:hypothetical protein